MLRAFIFSLSGLFSVIAGAVTPSLYQVDMIVFTHLQNTIPSNDSSSLIAPDIAQAIPLQISASKEMTPFHTRPAATSQLRNEYWALNRKPQYQVLFHYTWLQPGNNHRPVSLSHINNGGWNIEGTMRITQSNYYLFDTDLLFSAPNSTHQSFVFSQKQRLKPGVVYYLDHPQAGMLIKVHQIA